MSTLADRFDRVKARLSQPPRAPAKPRPQSAAWAHIDPVTQAVGLAKQARLAADCVGLFSLFALVAVFSGIAGAKHLTWEITHLGVWTWDPPLRLHMPWLPFLLAGAFGVWVFNRHGLRIALTLNGGYRWPWLKREPSPEPPTPWTKAAVIFGLCAFSALIVVTATKFQDGGRETDARAAAVVEEIAARDRAAVERDLALVQRDIDTLEQPGDETPNYQTQAARAGVDSWRQRIDAIRNAGNAALANRLAAELPIAKRADDLRARRTALQVEMAAAPVAAETAARVEVDRGVTGWIVTWFASIGLWFAIATEFLALIMKLVEFVLFRRAEALWRAAQAEAKEERAAERAMDSAAAEAVTQLVELAAYLSVSPSPPQAPLEETQSAPAHAVAALAAEESPVTLVDPPPAPPEAETVKRRARRLPTLPAPTEDELAAAGVDQAEPAVEEDELLEPA
jgi:hypothetical protein